MSCQQRAAHQLLDLERWVARRVMGLEAAEKLNATNDMNRDTAQLHVGVLRSW